MVIRKTLKSKVIKTFTGMFVDPLKMSEKDVDICDIAHALSNECRYAGHCPVFYSVAEHSLNTAYSVWLETESFAETFAALMHDASEAYLKDIPTPVKWRMKNYVTAENRLSRVIEKKYGITVKLKSIKWADVFELHKEQAGLRGTGRTPQEVEDAFLKVFNYLYKIKGDKNASRMVQEDTAEILRRYALSEVGVYRELQNPFTARFTYMCSLR